MGKSAAANWAARWTRGTVPNRANDPKRQMTREEYEKWSDELTAKNPSDIGMTKPVKGKSRF